MLFSCVGAGIDAITDDSETVPFADETPVAPVDDSNAADAEATPAPEATPIAAAPAENNAELPLFDRLMACTTAEEARSIISSASDEELSELTDAQIMEVEQRFAAGSSEVIGPQNVVSSSGVAPLVKDTSASNAVSKVKAKLLKAAPMSTANKETDAGHEGLFLNKNVRNNGDGTYTITLESYVTGNINISSETKNLPADIVLVLDVSGSMDEKITVGSKTDTSELDTKYGAGEGIYTIKYPISGEHPMRYQNGEWQYKYNGRWKELENSWFGTSISVTKMNALKIATKNFVDQVQAKSAADGVDHRIAIVKFAGNNNSNVGNQMSGSSNYSQKVINLTSASAANSIKTNVDNLKAGGATSADYGMSHAKDIINGITRESNKVVIMFTDGEPNHGSGFDATVANSTISTSKDIKATGATVYTIGVLSGANDTVPMPSNASNVNKYMHYVSSNFKNAISMDNGGTATYPGNGKSYYLAASNADQITGIFKQISEQIQTGGASRTLGTDSVVKDTVTQYFDMPDKASDIKVYTAKYQGYESDGKTRKFADKVEYRGANASMDGQTVSVTNFDYSSTANCVTDTKNANGSYTYTGNKLIIEFTITPKAAFFGGNQVPTNEATSGVYEKASNDQPLGAFVVPRTDVEIKSVTVEPKDKNVYYDSNVSENQLTAGAVVKCGGYDVSTAENWQKDFVNISTSSTAINSIENDTSYTVTATVSPKTSGEAKAKTASADAKVNVFKPEITFNDSAIDLGDTANYTDNGGTVVWKHGATSAETVTMTGSAPTLTFSYDTIAAAFTVDTYVNVTVKHGDKDITSAVTFKHDKCDFDKCSFDASEGEFIVHIKTFDLTISKKGWDTVDENQSFVFHIVCADKGVDMQVTVIGNGSVTVKGLPVGTYTITEDTAWAWRYNLNGVQNAVNSTGTCERIAGTDGCTYTPNGTNNSIVFTNSRIQYNWLSFVNYVKNVFGMKDA